MSPSWHFQQFRPGGRSTTRGLWGNRAWIADPERFDQLADCEKPARRAFLDEIDRSCLAGRDAEHVLAMEQALTQP